jgi:hypothetical protein
MTDSTTPQLSARLSAGPWEVRSWEQPGLAGSVSEDQAFAAVREHGLRLGVADGVTPSARTPARAGVTGALWAATVVRAAMHAAAPLESCARAANAELHDPALAGRDQTQASLVAADVGERGATVLRAGDCEAWVREGERWRELFTEPMLAPAALAELLAWLRANPGAGHDETVDRERELLAAPEAWNCTPVGRFAAGRWQVAELETFDELVLASDGARLTADRVAGLDEWLLGGLRPWEVENRTGIYRHGDVAVLRLARTRVHDRMGAVS